MAMHIYTSTGWKTINWNGYGFTAPGTPLQVRDGTAYQLALNAKVYSGGSWKGFLDNVTIDNHEVYGNPNYAEFTIHPNGTVYLNPGGPVYESWNMNADNSGQYEVYVEQQTGLSSVFGSALNTWLNLGSVRSWYINSPAPGGSAILDVTIRHATTQQQLAQSTFTLSMNYEPGMV